MYEVECKMKLSITRFLFAQSNLLLYALIGFSMPCNGQSDLNQDSHTLKENYLLQQALPAKRLQSCEQAFSKFNQQELDRFSAGGSRVLGVDLRGMVWEVKKKSSGECDLVTFSRLGVPEITKNSIGEIENVVYYYEPSSICAYSQDIRQSRPIRKLCYQPLGIVNKYAPYMSP
jgi:hypothetical protein